MDNNVQISQVLNVIGDTFINSDLSVNGSINSDSINSNSAKITGNLDVSGNTKSNTLNVTAKSVLEDVDLINLKSSSDITANGSLNVNGNLNLNKVVSENSGCSQNGEIARNSVGKLLSCISGVWISSSSTNKIRIISTYHVAYRWPSASVYCNSDEVVTGGGSLCQNGVGYTFLVQNRPNGNGWLGSCDTTKNVNTQINVYAICLKIN